MLNIASMSEITPHDRNRKALRSETFELDPKKPIRCVGRNRTVQDQSARCSEGAFMTREIVIDAIRHGYTFGNLT